MATPHDNRHSASGALNANARSSRTRNAGRGESGTVGRRRNTLLQYLDSKEQQDSLSVLARINQYKETVL